MNWTIWKCWYSYWVCVTFSLWSTTMASTSITCDWFSAPKIWKWTRTRMESTHRIFCFSKINAWTRTFCRSKRSAWVICTEKCSKTVNWECIRTIIRKCQMLRTNLRRSHWISSISHWSFRKVSFDKLENEWKWKQLTLIWHISQKKTLTLDGLTSMCSSRNFVNVFSWHRANHSQTKISSKHHSPRKIGHIWHWPFGNRTKTTIFYENSKHSKKKNGQRDCRFVN